MMICTQISGYWAASDEEMCIDAWLIGKIKKIAHCNGTLKPSTAAQQEPLVCNIDASYFYHGHLDFTIRNPGYELWVHLDGCFFGKCYKKDFRIMKLPHNGGVQTIDGGEGVAGVAVS